MNQKKLIYKNVGQKIWRDNYNVDIIKLEWNEGFQIDKRIIKRIVSGKPQMPFWPAHNLYRLTR